jgi:serine/threonine protein kinase/tetratricopeptide (TPR) repeat protein
VIGTTIAHYRVIERLGEGGMGEVFLVEDLKLQRREALKLIAAHLTRDETRRQRFLQEARLAASIDHPHIASIHDIGEVEGRTYIAMEYVEGRSLRDVLRTGAFKLRRALDLAIQAADALAKVHEHGVVHRDLKPENLLVANDGYVKIIDFGLAKLVDPLARSGLADAATMSDLHVRTAHGVVVGTIGYMSPEQVRGDPVDARTDVFSFGAVLYEMVTGQAPFRKKSSAETISAILGEAPSPPRVEDEASGVELQRILRKCLSKEPAARYQGMRDLAVDLRALRELLTSGETAARSAVGRVNTTDASSVADLSSSRSPLYLGAALLVALIAAGGAYYEWRARSTSPEPVRVSDASPVRPSVAILSFEVMSGGDDVVWLGRGLPSMLITGLAQTPDIEVVGNERLSTAAQQLGAASPDAVDRSRLADLARRAGAEFVLTGTIVKNGPDVRIDARVEDLGTGAVRVAQSVRGPDVFVLADDLSARVRAGLGIQAASVRKVADVASASIDAYKAYTSGVEAFENVRLADARRLFEEAIRLDPNFALAHYQLSYVSLVQGRMTEAGEHLQAAANHLDRLAERDALMVRAALEEFEGRTDRASSIYETVVSRYPDTFNAWFGLAGDDFVDAPRGLRVFERAVVALPYSPAALNIYGYKLMRTGRFTDAIGVFEKYVKLRPTETNALDSLAEAYLYSGDPVAALDRYRAAVKAGHNRAGVAYSLAVMGRHEEALGETTNPGFRSALLSRLGRYGEAERELAAVASSGEKNGDLWSVGAVSLYRAALALERSDCRAAQSHVTSAEQVLARIPSTFTVSLSIVADLLSGTCHARSGNATAARSRLARARSTYRPSSTGERWWVGALEGEIALSAGNATAAEKSFAAGEPDTKMWFSRGGQAGAGFLTGFSNNLTLRDGRARAAAAQGHLDDAIAAYRELLTPGPKQKWTAILDPLHVFELARLLDRDGQRDAARLEYQRFLDYWKNADRGLPQIAEATARLR